MSPHTKPRRLIICFQLFFTVTFECMDSQFACYSGRCIPIEWRCDNKVDCGIGDTADEDNCEGNG